MKEDSNEDNLEAETSQFLVFNTFAVYHNYIIVIPSE